MRCPLAGGEIAAKDAVEDSWHNPSHHFESICAVPWNQGQHDMTNPSTLDEVCAKDGFCHLRSGSISFPACNTGTIRQGVTPSKKAIWFSF